MTTAFITGLTGFVGSHLAEYLLANTDWDIVGLIRHRSSLDNLVNIIPEINKKTRVRLVYGDLRDSVAINQAVEQAAPDYIFHLAAQSYPQTSFASPLDTLETNVQGTARILEAAREYCPHAWTHICSSSEVFGRVPKEKLPINDSCSFHPASPYAISKVGADLLGQHYAEAYEMNVQVTRMFTHTGPRRGDVFAESSFAKQIALIEAGHVPPVLYHGNLHSLRTIADVRDAVRAYHMLLTCNPEPGAVYNIGGSHACEVGEILAALLKMSDVGIELRLDPARLRPIDVDLQLPDTRKFIIHTGWTPEIPFEQTMQDLLNYWREKVRKDGNAFLIR